jgi:hypothetical protein
MSKRCALERKKGFIQGPKNGKVGALLANPLLHSRKLKGYRQGRIKRERNS